MEKKIVKVEGELFWAKWMGEFNNAFGDTDRYECVIGNLTEESVKRLESIGVKVKYWRTSSRSFEPYIGETG